MNKEIEKYISSLRKYKTVKDYEEAIRKQGQVFDHVIVDGIIFTMDGYDSEGKSITYGNRASEKTMEIETENRYGPEKFKDAKVTIYDMLSYNNNINYLMSHGGIISKKLSKKEILLAKYFYNMGQLDGIGRALPTTEPFIPSFNDRIKEFVKNNNSVKLYSEMKMAKEKLDKYSTGGHIKYNENIITKAINWLNQSL